MRNDLLIHHKVALVLSDRSVEGLMKGLILEVCLEIKAVVMLHLATYSPLLTKVRNNITDIKSKYMPTF